jgi:hypothetical protein
MDRPRPRGALKQCTKCGRWLGPALFPRDRANRSGLSTWCRPCHRAATNASKLGGVGVSPWEALVLAVCLVPAVLLARLAVRLRLAAQGA